MGLCNSQSELYFCRRRYPQIRFACSKLPKLNLGRRRFDKVICVEGPSCYGDPAALLEQIYKRLKPGGQLVCSDVLSDPPPSSEASDADGYRQLLEQIGFENVRVVDVTPYCTNEFRRQLTSFIWAKTLAKEVDTESAKALWSDLPCGEAPVVQYWLISALKKGSKFRTV